MWGNEATVLVDQDFMLALNGPSTYPSLSPLCFLRKTFLACGLGGVGEGILLVIGRCSSISQRLMKPARIVQYRSVLKNGGYLLFIQRFWGNIWSGVR